eukprot:CAMPEP_0172523900 /NCGR_PEP_ID=MMETSP1066-20121228/293904_1 /TAXON_ID=671091 /ORGANISM="Coscinodiscus wailesii, Strain CCMP2513" /LENGTH=254 /DNA_ID=CAMNT_0013306997 /DNA_START=175 /DNA_END=936 /DNA_ORIENTATION=+
MKIPIKSNSNLQMTNNQQTVWGKDATFIRDYETRVEPFTASFVEELMHPFLSEAPPLPSEMPTLLDVGCGTGAVSLLAQQKGYRVTSTDVSPAMVSRCRERRGHDSSSSSTPDARLTNDEVSERCCVVADGENLPPSWSDKFEHAVGNFSIIFFPDPLRGLKEIRRCLRPGGRVAVSAWGDSSETPAFRIFPDATAAVAPEQVARSRPKRIVGGVSSLTTLMEEAGFGQVRVLGPVTRLLEVSSPAAYFDRMAL